MQSTKLSITLSKYLVSLARPIMAKELFLLMRNISLEIQKVSYSGQFYFKATLDMVLYKEIGQLLLRYQFK